MSKETAREETGRTTPAEASRRARGELSYHYWHGRNAGEAPAAEAKVREGEGDARRATRTRGRGRGTDETATTRAQRITAAEAEALSRQVSSTQISAWNAAGTWEERGHTEWARARVAALAREGGAFDLDGEFRGVRVEIVDVKKCEGDASVVMIRGKPRHGFDFELTLKWKASFPGESEEDEAVEIKGTIHVPEFSRDGAADEECVYEVKVDDRKSEHAKREDACVSTLKKRCESFLVRTLKQIDKELFERASA